MRYAGLHDLPEGERWGHPAPGGQYPLAAFDFAGDAQTAPFTLSFADGEGCQGLHRHYDAAVERQTLRQRLTIGLHVAPDEFAALEWADGGTHASLRSTFRLDAGGESSLYRLEVGCSERFGVEQPLRLKSFSFDTGRRPTDPPLAELLLESEDADPAKTYRLP